jgi:DNA polymerase III subunit epsilon
MRSKGAVAVPLTEEPVLFLDIQTTGRNPERDQILEIGWAIDSATNFSEETSTAFSSLVTLEGDNILDPLVAELTGIAPGDLENARPLADLWNEMNTKIHALHPTRGMIHYARFEKRFLKKSGLEVTFPFLCTYQIAKKLFPALPSWGIRALSGNFGMPLPEIQRASTHVHATFRIWHHLARILEEEKSIQSWEALETWLSSKDKTTPAKKQFLVSSDIRKKIPKGPGIYRMRSRNKKVLYVGKATSLYHRVNSYFTKHSARGRIAELLTQVSDIDFTPTESVLEAALWETKEIKKWDPPYNTSLRLGSRRLWYFNRQLLTASNDPSDTFSVGPFLSDGVFSSLLELSGIVEKRLQPVLLFSEPPDPEALLSGISLILETFDPRVQWKLALAETITPREWLEVGFRAWRNPGLLGELEDLSAAEEGAWTRERVACYLKRKLMNKAGSVLRARLLCRLTENVICWRSAPPVFQILEWKDAELVGPSRKVSEEHIPFPANWARTCLERQMNLTVGAYDQLRVLTTELKRMITQGDEIRLRLSPNVTLTERRLGKILFPVVAKDDSLRHFVAIRDNPTDSPLVDFRHID